MASLGAVKHLVHPILADALAASVMAWTRAYAKYESDVRAVSLQHHEDEEISALPLVACISPSLLGGFVTMGLFEGRSEAEKVASDDARKWVVSAAEVEDMDVASTVKTALAGPLWCGHVTNVFVDVFNALLYVTH